MWLKSSSTVPSASPAACSWPCSSGCPPPVGGRQARLDGRRQATIPPVHTTQRIAALKIDADQIGPQCLGLAGHGRNEDSPGQSNGASAAGAVSVSGLAAIDVRPLLMPPVRGLSPWARVLKDGLTPFSQ